VSALPRVGVLAGVIVLLLCSCSKQANTFVPDGAYSGSTSTNAEVDLQVNSGEIKLDGKVLKRDDKLHGYVEKKRKWAITCKTSKGTKDIICRLTRAGHTETVELMFL
jgi:hypothetical protein